MMKLSHVFNTGIIALAIDLLVVFPISHTSMIGQAITSASSSIIVPPLDWLATDVFGMEDAADSFMDAGSGFGGDAAFESNLTGASVGDQVMPNPFGPLVPVL